MPSEKWLISEEEMDDQQYDIKRIRHNYSYIVEGCAGSGKTVLALWRAKEIQDRKQGTYYVIVFTRALKRFISNGIKEIGLDPNRVLYEWEWNNIGSPSADYFIVDEAQDFPIEKITDFMNKKKISISFWGDDNQQLYSEGSSLGKIKDITKLSLRSLNRNYRLPKKLARFAQHINKEKDDLESRCVLEGDYFPFVRKYDSQEQEIDSIINTIKNKQLNDIGILLPRNEDVKLVSDILKRKRIDFEMRLIINNENIETLNFESSNPKVMTYWAAKGLQFRDVFIPFCEQSIINKNSDDFYRNALYVAITRASNSVTITYSDKINNYLSNIPREYYDDGSGKSTTKPAF